MQLLTFFWHNKTQKKKSTNSEIGRHLLMFPKEIKALRFNPLVSISWINCDESGKSRASARIYTYYELMNLLKVTKALYQSQNG